MSVPRLFEARRYSAVLLNDVGMSEDLDLLRALRISLTDCSAVEAVSGGWDVTRASVPSLTNFYPSVPRTRGGENVEFLHEMYVATKEANGHRLTLLASPYVGLLEKCLSSINAERGSDVGFLKVDMDAVFSHFELIRHQHLSATRISVLMGGDVGLEVVSLSGRNPLRSDLRDRLAVISSPYSIRVKGTYLNQRGTNMHADRHGNLWWHLGVEAALVNVFAFLNLVAEHGNLRATTSSPLRRVLTEEEVIP